MSPHQIGKLLIITGIAITAAGILTIALGKTGIFNLPGDIRLEGKNWKIYFPIASSIIISAILTLTLWLINIFRR